MAWCETSIKILATLWKQGHSCSEIAARINRATGRSFTRNAVIGKRCRLGLPDRAPRKKAKTAASGPGYRTRLKTDALNPVPPPIVPEDAIRYENERVQAGLVPLLELAGDHCRWPIGDLREPEFGFCGAAAVPTSVYCKHHTMRAAPVISSRPPPQRPAPDRPYTPAKSKELV